MAIWGGVACCTSASERVVSMVAQTIPLAPFLPGRGKKLKLSGGHPQTPAKEAVPLWTPPHVMPIVDVPPHVLVPLPPPSRAGLPRRPAAAPDCFAGEEIKALWGTPPDPCQRGCAPLDSPARNAHCGCPPTRTSTPPSAITRPGSPGAPPLPQIASLRLAMTGSRWPSTLSSATQAWFRHHCFICTERVHRHDTPVARAV